MEDGSWFGIRPSGTEPKIKFYYYAKKENEKKAEDTVRALEEAVTAMADAVE